MKNKLTPEHCYMRFELCRDILYVLMQESGVSFHPRKAPYKRWDDLAKFYLRNIEIYKAPVGMLDRKIPRKMKKSQKK